MSNILPIKNLLEMNVPSDYLRERICITLLKSITDGKLM